MIPQSHIKTSPNHSPPRDAIHGGVYYFRRIPIQERTALHDLIASLDDWSIVSQFAFGRWDGAVPPHDPIAGEPLGTEVHVVQSWHQPSQPHVTVRLVWAYAHV